ncbi:hypothetical protein AAG570_001742 [Ranatra chinensis]|uniref:Uncharacterized protein n=1 Tax=Ranatra chinensis TaxID=642074 RepID=A0ABD0YLC9_9HEMI
MQLGNIPTKLKKKDKIEDSLPETWDDVEEKGCILIKDVAPPPPPPTKDEMAQDLKKKVEKKKEASIETKAPAPSMDILGGFIINPAVVTSNLAKSAGDQKHKSGGGRGGDSDSDGGRKDKRSSSSRSRSRSPPPRKKYISRSASESSGSSYKVRSRSKSGSYNRLRRYRSSESGSYRSRSYSRSRSRSRSGEYRRSRSRSDDRSYRKYPGGGGGRYPRNRGTYYRPRFQNSSSNYKNRGGNRGGYRNNRGGGQGYRDYRDYRNRGFPRRGGRGRGGGGGGPRYFHYRPRERDYSRRYDRGGSRSDDDRDSSPMRKVDAAKERIDKLIAQHPSSQLSDRDDDYVDRKEYDGKWAATNKEEPINDDKI